MMDHAFSEEILRKLDELDAAALRAPKKLPDRKRIISILKKTFVVLLPDFYPYRSLTRTDALSELGKELVTEIQNALCRAAGTSDSLPDSGAKASAAKEAKEKTSQFLSALPEVKRLLLTDIQAIYDGDPAAKSKAEVLLCYPGFYAIAIYRIAHVLYALSVPLIPRIMTEYAHEKTGIDINPGAVIGEYFCIDHGTGIVIGETAVLGSHVKLYQGVTIGAKSFEKDERGMSVKGGKRHPDIGDHVIIYAGATILGGRTHIGDRAVIGGNVWVTHSVEGGAHVTYSADNERLIETPEYVI
ncbi:MAG: serine acetyltransferase [Lachnospiraceae bacterium]|nr:serine acetyltransferase [Lachnospiraceae bacterium]